MGAGHDQVAQGYADRLSARGATTRVVDLLSVLPGPLGPGLRHFYAGMLRATPWLYEGIYRTFFVPRKTVQPSTSPMVTLAARGLAPLVADFSPTAVISTFHLAGQAVGRLRSTGRLTAPAVVAIVDAVAHKLWLDQHNDLFVTAFSHVADQVRRSTARDVIAPGPLVDSRFGFRADAGETRARLGIAADADIVVVSTGSWGVGHAVATARVLAGIPSVHPVVLCGRNDKLRTAVAGVAEATALGWRDDLPAIFAAARVLVDNAGGATCVEAFAADLPVVEYRPIPGHGRAGASALADAGLVSYPASAAALVAEIDALRRPGAVRERRLVGVAGMFVEDPAAAVARWVSGWHRSRRWRRRG